MVDKKIENKNEKKDVLCNDKTCPTHGSNPIKLRGRIFEGTVIKKFPKRICIQFDRTVSVPKYERYEKRRTKLHARLPDCMKNKIEIGDYIKIAECRPLSRIIHFVVTEKIRSKEEKK